MNALEKKLSTLKTLNNKPVIAALYLRLSKEDIDKINKGDDSESIKNQRSLLIEEAIKREFVIGDIYSDEDFSGMDSARPEFNRLIEDAKQKKFDVILCKTQSRFTRDMEMVEKYIHREFPLLGIRFIGVVDNADTEMKGNKKARQINALINEWYVEDLSENIKTVYRSKMHQGQYLGSFALYGYMKDPKDRHKLVIDEEAAEVVRKIFRFCLEGYGAQNICYKLQEEGILTPTEYKQSKGMKFYTPLQAEGYAGKYHLWSPSTIKNILSNEMYIGSLVQGREKKMSYKEKKTVTVPKDEWVIIPNNHEPIISKEDFYKVQEVMKLRRKCSSVSDKRKKPYPLAGKVRCRECGSPMLRTGPKGTNQNYLRCRLAARSHREKCTSHSIKYNDLEEKVLSALQLHVDEILSDEVDCDEISDAVKPQKSSTLIDLQRRYSKLKAEHNRFKSGLKRCYMDRYAGDLEEKLFFDLCLDYNKKIESIQQSLEETECKIKTLEEVNDSEEGARQFIKKYTTFSDLSYDLVYEFINFVEIGEKNEEKEQEVIVHWKF